MEGKISVESDWGKGSTFTLALDGVDVSATAGNENKSDDALADLNNFEASKILVVDDNPFNRELVEGYLHGSRHEIAFATNGKEGVEQAESIKPDVVLMDIRMPVMDGREAFKQIKGNPEIAETPILAVTASSLIQEERRLRKEFDGYLRKPFSRSQLVGALENVLVKDSESPALKSGIDIPTQDAPKIDHWPKMMIKLKELETTRVTDLKATMALGEMSEFAEELSAIGEDHHCPPLIEFAEELLQSAGSFELSTIESLLERFPLLVKELSAVTDQQTTN